MSFDIPLSFDILISFAIQIAAQLDVSEVTVKVHRGHIMRKMRSKSLPELVQMAAKLCVSSLKW